ncbi:MAG: glycosyltransferase family 4 protein [Thiotrichales bacterium]
MDLHGKSILFLVPTRGFGGAELHSITLAKQLRDRGAKLTLCFRVEEVTRRVFEHCAAEDFNVRSLPLALVPGATILESAEKQRKVVSDNISLTDYDFVFIAAPSPKAALGLMAAVKAAGVPSCTIFHLVAENTRFSDSERRYFAEAISERSHMVCVSEFTRDCLAQACRLPISLFEVIENGVEIKPPAPIDAETFRASFGRLGYQLVLTSGRLHKQKGIQVLLEAMPLIIAEFPKTHFVFFGDGEQKGELLDQIRERGLASYVSFAGHVTDPYRYFHAADIVLLPTLYEGLSLTLLEAMHSGSCILTTDASYQDRIITDGVDGVIAEVGNAEDLAERAVALLGDAPARFRYREAILGRARDFTVERMLGQYDLLVDDSLLNKGQAREVSSLQRDCHETLVLNFGESTVELEQSLRSESVCAVKMTLAELIADDKQVNHEFLCDWVELSYTVSGSNRWILGSVSVDELLDRSPLRAVMQQIELYEYENQLPVPFIWESIVIHLLNRSSHGLDRLNDYLIVKLFKHYIRFGAASNGAMSALMDAWEGFPLDIRKALINQLAHPLFISESGRKFDWIADHFESLKECSPQEYSHFEKCYQQATGKPIWAEGLAALNNPEFQGEAVINGGDAQRVLMFAAHYSYPPKNGSDNRVTDVLRAYRALGYEVMVYTWSKSVDKDAVITAALELDLGIQHQVFHPKPETRKHYSEKFRHLTLGQFDAADFYNEQLHVDFYRVCDTYQPDILHINYFYFGWLVSCVENRQVKTVLDTHDLVSKRVSIFKRVNEICGRLPTHAREVRSAVFNSGSFRALAYEDADENDVLSMFDKVLMISESELGLVESHIGGAEAHFLPYLPEFSPSPLKSTNRRNGLFLGSKNAMNIMGAAAITKVLAPRASAMMKDFRCSIAGHVTDAVDEAPGVDRLGFVASVESLYSNHDYVLCPLPAGTGQNIKVTEGLAHGLPVITFPAVAESSGVRHNVNGLIANDLDEYYEYVKQITTDPHFFGQLQANTQSWAKEAFSVEHFNRLFEAAIQ